jgi:hypothetical protein
MLRLRVRRHAVVLLDRPRPRVVRRERLPDVPAEPVELLTKVLRAAVKVLLLVVRVDPETTSGLGHELGLTDRAGLGPGVLVAAGFLLDECAEQRRVDPVALRCGLDGISSHG